MNHVAVQHFPVPEVRPLPQAGWRAIAIGIAAIFVMLVDGTAANTINAGLPYLQGISAATPDEASWIITAFNAAYYSTILFSPWLYARFARKPLLLFGLLGFAAVSLLLIVTQPLEWVIALRFLQGMCLGCVFVPAAAMLFTSLPLRLLPFAPPIFAVVVLGAGTMGSFIGGYLSETYGGFAVYAPSAIATIVGALLVYYVAPGLDKPQRGLRPDVPGVLLILLFFGSLQYLANEGERRNWFDDGGILAAAVLLVLAVAAFMIWELYITETPLINLRLLTQKRNLAVGSAINVVLGGVGYSVVIFALYLETQVAATATLAGALILLRLATYIPGIVLAFFLVKQRILGIRAVIVLTAAASALAFLAFSVKMTPSAEAATFVAITLLFGLVFSMLNQPVPAVVLGTLGLTDIAAGLSLYKLSALVGLSIGTGIVQTMLDHSAAAHGADLAGFMTTGNLPVARFLSGGGNVGTLAALVNGQAQALAFDDVMRVFALCVLLTIPLVFFADTRAPAPK
ncbi:MAG TPA: MFS transporter [Candidatus Baltobacteraceae bacterium]|nr:MFS transporter [Candidatus Baltobacteraceae bacterium]